VSKYLSNIMAGCFDCGDGSSEWDTNETPEANLAEAKKHHRKTGHHVWANITYQWEMGDRKCLS
jgi:hypothetical protein